MSDLATVDRTLAVLGDPAASLADRIAAYAVAHQWQLRVNRVLRASRDDLIVGMTRDGLNELGPVSIKASAVDPSYPANEPDNWTDAGVQDAMAALRANRDTRGYIRAVPAHLEIDVLALAADVQLGVQAALNLYRELNRRRWRVESARRLSLAVREPRGEAAA